MVKDLTTNTTIQNAFNFIYARIPQFEEAKINSFTKGALDLFLGRVVDSFGLNPTASNVFRDGLKTIINFQLIGVEVGSTGIIHDYAGFYGAILKTSCKASILAGYVYLYKNAQNLENIGRSSNYICEIAPRYLNIVSREKQLSEKKTPHAEKQEYFSYLTTKAEFKWWLEAGTSSFFKILTSDLVGEYFIKPLGYQQYMRNTATNLENNMLSYLPPSSEENSFTPKDDIYAKIEKIASSAGINNMLEIFSSAEKTAMAAMQIGSIALVDYSSNFIKEMISCYIFITSTKTIQDASGLVIQYFTHPDVASNATIAHDFINIENTTTQNITVVGENSEL
jgi:hypothetical protein